MKEKIFLIIFIIVILSIINYREDNKIYYGMDNIPEYMDKYYVEINNNIPYFTEEDLVLDSYEKYSELDHLGRAGVAIANISKDIMPTEKRESIRNIRPSGWHTVRYDIVQDYYLYNRCHLIAYRLSGENDNEKNLITCTKHMNTDVMTIFENEVAEYIYKTNNHVLYRVTPIYINDNLLASGVEIEALSIEDNGTGVKFNVFIYNVQDGIEINYKDGSSKLKGD